MFAIDLTSRKCVRIKLVIGLVRLESLRPGSVDSGFESLISGFVIEWLHIQAMKAEAVLSALAVDVAIP